MKAIKNTHVLSCGLLFYAALCEGGGVAASGQKALTKKERPCAMKVTVNVECTPEEARTFMGLPDVRPMQDAMMAELESRMRANIQSMSPENMMKTWLPASLQGADNLQKMFWSQMQNAMSGVVSTAGAALSLKDKAS